MRGGTPIDDIPGVAECTLAFRSLRNADLLKHKLRWLETSMLEPIRVAFVGASYSGVEVTCKLAKRLGGRGRIQMIQRSDKILPNYLKCKHSFCTRGVNQEILSSIYTDCIFSMLGIRKNFF